MSALDDEAARDAAVLAAKRLRARNAALLSLLLGFVAAIFLLTLIKVQH